MSGAAIFAIVCVAIPAAVFGLMLATGGLRLRSGKIIGRQRRNRPKRRNSN
jgi:hypothetical protein